MSKRLILGNIKELLYAAFKARHPDAKIGFSTFAALRPKWCIPVGPKGSHIVCVCTHHKNVKLLLDVEGLKDHYHEILEMVVCDINNKQCMIHRCQNCPCIENVENFLRRMFCNGGEFEDGGSSDHKPAENEEEEASMMHETITIQQWTSTDRTDLVTYTSTVEEFLAVLCKKLDAITSHSFIAKSQASYLKNLKNEVEKDEVIVLGDFAENYKFLVQDDAQGYHWNQQQCSLHPVVIYICCYETSTITAESLCFISDDLEHDVSFVHDVMKGTATFVKEKISTGISKFHYFSDGCAGQYKNCKNFLNLCYRREDFGIDCEWNFFATSHGKSPCDGIGGTVKRLTAKASLQRSPGNQILSAAHMMEFCSNFIAGIHFFFISQIARTVLGTRSFHQFISLPQGKIGVKRTSVDTNFEAVLLESQPKMKNSKKSSVLDVFWSVRMVTFFGLGF